MQRIRREQMKQLLRNECCYVRRNFLDGMFAVVLAIVLHSGLAYAQDVTSTVPAPPPAAKGEAKDPNDILGMDIEQLAQAPVKVATGSSGIDMNVPVTSVAKEQSTIGKIGGGRVRHHQRDDPPQRRNLYSRGPADGAGDGRGSR